MYEQITDIFTPGRLLIAAVVFHWVGRLASADHEKARKWALIASLAFVGGVFAYSVPDPKERDAGEYLVNESPIVLLLIVTYLGVFSLVFVVGWNVFQIVVLNPCRWIRGRLRSINNQIQKRRERADERRRHEQYLHQQELERPIRERQAAERAKEREREDEAKRLAAIHASEDQKRREVARRALLLCYHQHSPQIDESISWERFQHYCQTYLSDATPADRVESNAEQMMDTIRSLFEEGTDEEQFDSIESIRSRFEEERNQIRDAGFSEEQTASMIADTHFREDQALMERRT